MISGWRINGFGGRAERLAADSPRVFEPQHVSVPFMRVAAE